MDQQQHNQQQQQQNQQQQQQQQQNQQQNQQQQQQQQQQQEQPNFATPIAPNPAPSRSTVGSDNFNSVPTMYHQQQQPQQHIAAAPVTVASNAMSSQVMGQLMTNPALAAVAAATPLLPPAAMMTNPGAFLTMPEYYTMTNPVMNDPQQQQQQQQLTAKISAAAINSSVGAIRPQQVTAGQQIQQQYQQQQQQQQQSQPAQIFTVPGMQYPTILPYGVTLSNSVLAATPGVNPMAPSSVQVHMAANAAASQAIAAANANNNGSTNLSSSSNNIPTANFVESCVGATTAGGKKRTKDLTAQERAQQNRDRNREHARSTRLRKKAYVSKLKELVEGLHAERTEEVRQRRVAIQHLAETQDVRRAVVRSFLRFQSSYETDKRKWMTLLEDDFWLKQPVTPYRCFRRSEIKNVSNLIFIAAIIEYYHYRNWYDFSMFIQCIHIHAHSLSFCFYGII